jgi:hypothetical protein
MKVNTKIMAVRRERAHELEIFARLLEKMNLGRVQQIHEVISNLRDETERFPSPGETDYNCWGYTIYDLIFNIQNFPKRHVKPNIDIMQLSIDIDLLSRLDDWGKLKDPLIKLNFKVKISGVYSGQKYSVGFHIDRHEDNGSEEVHPIYHLHYSPDVGENTNLGNVLSLDAPRIMHAPIDLILGIDFVLSNFSPSTWNKLRNEFEYIALCRRYQDSLWKPYVHAWASGWKYEFTDKCSPSPESICPHLVSRKK